MTFGFPSNLHEGEVRSAGFRYPESPPFILAEILQGPGGSLLKRLLRGQHRDLRQAFRNLDPRELEKLRKETGNTLGGWASLSKESNPTFFFKVFSDSEERRRIVEKLI